MGERDTHALVDDHVIGNHASATMPEMEKGTGPGQPQSRRGEV